MSRYQEVKGLAVISLAEGAQIGKVDEVVVDPDRKVVCWLRLHSGGLLGDRTWVPVEAVYGVGTDAVTIRAQEAVRAQNEAPEADAIIQSRRVVIGSPAVTETGQRLGVVRDYEFAPDNFRLTYLHIPPGMDILGQHVNIDAEKVQTIGPDVIVVRDDAVVRLDEKEPEAAASAAGAPA
jgi:uncharacterized protein YrrD